MTRGGNAAVPGDPRRPDLPNRFEEIPAALRERPQWVVWQTETRWNRKGEEKATKVPYDPKSDRKASSTDPATWGSFEAAASTFADGGFGGLGFVFKADDPYAGIDLDDCRNLETGELAAWAMDIVTQLDSYTEVSPSGEGVHVITCAVLPPGRRRKGSIEMYDEARFFCMTGARVEGAPAQIEDRQAQVEALHAETFKDDDKKRPSRPSAGLPVGGVDLDDESLLQKVRASKNGNRFSRLYDAGDFSGYDSQSEADLALCSHLAFWTNRDAVRMDGLFRRSSLFRQKWDENHFTGGRTYGQVTVEKAIAGVTDGYGARRIPESNGAEVPERRASDGPRERVVIKIEGGALPVLVDAAEAALLGANGPELYQRGGLLVRVICTEGLTVRSGVKRPTGALQIHAIEPAYLTERFTSAARWQVFDDRRKQWKSIDCPARIAHTYMARRGDWRLQPLIGIIEAPTLRPDGSILDEPGYDPETGLLFVAGNTQFPPIPDHPTMDDAKLALEELRAILDEFRFVTFADEAVALSAILTGLVRRAFGPAPMHPFSSPKMRSGKTTLADTAAMIATGRPPAVMSQAKDQDEEKKRLLAVLLAGDPVILYDNIDRPFGGAAISQVLTQETITDRVLGFSKMGTAPTAALFLATGNNLTFERDISCRVLKCTIDPQMERPEERTFKRDLYSYVPKHRGRLVVAGLTVLRAYVVAGRPAQGLPPWAGFDDWSNLVRSALVWCGMADPCETRRGVEEQDPERRILTALLTTWHEYLGSDHVTASDLVKHSTLPKDSPEHAPNRGALRDALIDAAGRGDAVSTRALGRYLQEKAMRIEGGFRIERVGTRSGATLWSVVPWPKRGMA